MGEILEKFDKVNIQKLAPLLQDTIPVTEEITSG
jgi:hypothetical protein